MASERPRYHLRRRARLDLEGIWRYTAEHWSGEQARRYDSHIWAAIFRLGQEPQLGRKVPSRPHLLKYPVGSHVIFFKPLAHGIEVVRVLHARMDTSRHL